MGAEGMEGSVGGSEGWGAGGLRDMGAQCGLGGQRAVEA